MRRMRMAWIAVVVAVGVAVNGSAGAQPQFPGPPNLIASAAGMTTGPMPATRSCWQLDPEGFLCADDIPTGQEPLLAVTPGTVISVGFSAGAPLTIRVRLLDAPNPRVPIPQADPHLVTADFATGVHSLIVTTTWSQGSADYVFRVEVRPVPPVRAPLDRTG